MKTVRFTLSIGYSGCEHVDTQEFEDDVTDEELDEAWQEWSSNYIDGGWHKVP